MPGRPEPVPELPGRALRRAILLSERVAAANRRKVRGVAIRRLPLTGTVVPRRRARPGDEGPEAGA
ncbi:hypothetical protein [Kineococcus sp. SYSU DK018]|uniref:hypothetical protein n=1 Tax=Kineococcus sp. SYSU DK018 TaxID=3383139 RepID=UPI003D7D7085